MSIYEKKNTQPCKNIISLLTNQICCCKVIPPLMKSTCLKSTTKDRVADADISVTGNVELVTSMSCGSLW